MASHTLIASVMHSRLRSGSQVTRVHLPGVTASAGFGPVVGGAAHAPTGAIIHQFCQLALHGLTTRVAHFEQPVFAWR